MSIIPYPCFSSRIELTVPQVAIRVKTPDIIFGKGLPHNTRSIQTGHLPGRCVTRAEWDGPCQDTMVSECRSRNPSATTPQLAARCGRSWIHDFTRGFARLCTTLSQANSHHQRNCRILLKSALRTMRPKLRVVSTLVCAYTDCSRQSDTIKMVGAA